VIQLYAEGTTDVGRKRDHNEDRIFCDPTLGLYIVCDGMGGHEAGEVAAEMVTDHLVEAMSEAVGSELGASEEAVAEALGDALERALTDANAAVNTFALEQGQKRGMGTTCTAMIAHGAHATICHVGDSRCYLVRDGRLYQMTQDHSWVAEMVRLGRMTKQEAERSPQRNLLVRSVGTQPVVKVDRLPLDLVANDNVLICSDGLHSYFASPSELVELLQRGDVAQLPKDFVSLACSRGGHDNVSAVVVRMPSADEMPPSHRDPKAELELLGKIELFADFELPELVRIRGAASLVGFADGESVTVKGEQGDAMYVLVEGRAMVAVEEEVLTTLSVGSHVGEMALVDARPRSASVVSMGPSQWLRLARGDVFRIIRRNPELAVKLLWNVVRSLSERLRQTNASLQARGDELKKLSADLFQLTGDDELLVDSDDLILVDEEGGDSTVTVGGESPTSAAPAAQAADESTARFEKTQGGSFIIDLDVSES
jgi:serine/threonine protein phosphatase PrpC/CRP-like cAMP-binding protein